MNRYSVKLMELFQIITPIHQIPKNLVFCKNRLLDLKYNVGFAFDGDGDRLGVIDDKGRIISGDKLLLLLAKEMLKSQKCKVIADVKM